MRWAANFPWRIPALRVESRDKVVRDKMASALNFYGQIGKASAAKKKV